MTSIKATFVETFKRLNIEYDKGLCTNSTENIQQNKEATNSTEEVEQYFPGFIAFTDFTEQQIPRPVNKNRSKTFYSGKEKIHTVKNQLMVNNHGYILHKIGYKKGRKHDYMFSI